MTEQTDAVQIFHDLQDISFLRIFFIIAATWLLITLIEKLFPWVADRISGRLRLSILSFIPILRLGILILAIFLVVPQVIEPTFQNLVAILGAVGLALGFAFKDYASSLMAGMVAIYERPYRPGDWVEIDGAYGEVKSLGPRALKLLTADDTAVTIPHSKIWTSNIYNSNDGQRDLLCAADFYLHPDHDAAKVRQKLYDVAMTSPYVGLERPITVVVSEKPWGTHYRLKAYPLDGRDQFQFTSDLTVRGKTALRKMNLRHGDLSPVALFEGKSPL